MAKLKKVLIAYDGSRGAKAALAHLARGGVGLPQQMEVVVLCVADAWITARFSSFGPYGLDAAPVTESQLQAINEAEEAELKRARATALDASQRLRIDWPDWQIAAESCADSPAWGIIRRADEWKAELIVMGSHGRSTLGRIMLGSVSQVVVREAPCAVRVVRGPIGKQGAAVCLIIGFDGSPDAEAAVEAVAARVWPAGSAVRLVTAINGRASASVALGQKFKAHSRQELAWMNRMIEDPVQRLRRAGLSVSSTVKLGDPRRVLIQEAKRRDAHCIFVGARGLRGIKRFQLGSVSTAVAMQAPCPVEVVRPARIGFAQEPHSAKREKLHVNAHG